MKNAFFTILFLSLISYSQKNEIDSLKQIVKTTTNDSVKVSILNKLAYQHIFNDEKIARAYLKQSEKIALNKNLKYGYNEIINIKGIFSDISGNSDSAKYYFLKSYNYSKKNNFKTIEARSVNNLGMYNWNKGNFNNALNYFFEALKINETLPEDKKIKESICFSNIGLIYQEMKLFDKAIEYHKKAYNLRLKDKLYKDQAVSLNNLGICYRNLKDYKNAINSFNMGMEVSKKSDNIVEYCKNIENLSSVYIDLQQYDKALENNLLVENIRKTIPSNNKEDMLLNTNISMCYYMLKNYNKAQEYGNQAISIINKDASLSNYASDLYRVLASTNYALGNIEKGDAYNIEFYNLLNQSFSESNSKNLAEMEIKYQTEKKEKQLLLTKNKLISQELKHKKKNTYLIISILLTLFSVLIGYLIYRQQKIKNEQQKQQFKLKNALSEIEHQNNLNKQRLSISRDLHDNIGSQLTFIITAIDNLQYKFNLKDLPIQEQLFKINAFTKETIIELRDTIWAMNSGTLKIENLEERITNFVTKAKESTENLNFIVNIDETLKNILFNSQKGINIYRSIQEAINNAIKHAQASKIVLSIIKIDNALKIIIKDNGKGFNKEQKILNNGILNMQKRMAEINADTIIESEINNGTSITFIIPINS